jgi:hypothetical protein
MVTWTVRHWRGSPKAKREEPPFFERREVSSLAAHGGPNVSIDDTLNVLARYALLLTRELSADPAASGAP